MNICTNIHNNKINQILVHNVNEVKYFITYLYQYLETRNKYNLCLNNDKLVAGFKFYGRLFHKWESE